MKTKKYVEQLKEENRRLRERMSNVGVHNQILNVWIYIKKCVQIIANEGNPLTWEKAQPNRHKTLIYAMHTLLRSLTNAA